MRVVQDDVFLDMPSSSQNLYFHLNMNADDDGFVSPKKIMRMCSATIDDLQVLVAKRYVIIFDSGVAVIKHWTLHNTIKKDRKIATTYQKEFAQLTFNEWGAYTTKKSYQTTLLGDMHAPTSLRHDGDNKNTTLNRGKVPYEMQNVSEMSPQYSIDKVSIDTNTKQLDISTTNNSNSPTKKERVPTETLTEMMQEWENIVGMEIDDMANRKACAAMIRDLGKEKVIQLIRGVALAMNDKYAPRISDFVSLKRKKNDLILWGRKKGSISSVGVVE